MKAKILIGKMNHEMMNLLVLLLELHTKNLHENEIKLNKTFEAEVSRYTFFEFDDHVGWCQTFRSMNSNIPKITVALLLSLEL